MCVSLPGGCSFSSQDQSFLLFGQAVESFYSRVKASGSDPSLPRNSASDRNTAAGAEEPEEQLSTPDHGSAPSVRAPSEQPLLALVSFRSSSFSFLTVANRMYYTPFL